MGGARHSRRGCSRRRRSPRTAVAAALLAAVSATPAGAASDTWPIEPRVVNGSLAESDDYPFVAALLSSGVADPFAAQFCGGSVVAPSIVITAAHCVDDLPAIDVLVNTDRLVSGHGDRIPVASILVHPHWDRFTARNDLALLYLASPSSARRIRVVQKAGDFRAAPHEIARVAGYGCVEYDAGSGACNGYPDRMYKAALPLLSDDECRTGLGPDYHARTMRCAGGTSAGGHAPDSCFGDSGGPLVVKGPAGSGRPLLVGLVSWGPGCGDSPSAYTRLSRHRGWLKKNGVPMRGAFERGPAVSRGGDADPVSGDFDGDGRDDVLWHTDDSSPDVLWRGRPKGFVGAGALSCATRGVPVVGDFDGDGLDDILWYREGPRRDTLSLGTASGFTRGPDVDVGSRFRPVAGDFDGDGLDDILWYGREDRRDALWRGRAHGFVGRSVVQRGGDYEPIAGDFDGDGRDDVLWFDRGPSGDPVWRGTAGGFAFGPAQSISGGYSPAVGDFDGDGRTDVFWHQPRSGHNLVWRGSPGGFDRFEDVSRRGADAAVTGDFGGDGRDDVLLFAAGPAPDLLLRGVRR